MMGLSVPSVGGRRRRPDPAVRRDVCGTETASPRRGDSMGVWSVFGAGAKQVSAAVAVDSGSYVITVGSCGQA